MNNTLVCVLAFTSGAAVGAVVSWKLLKTKYEQIAQEEIDSVKEMYSTSTETEDTDIYEVESAAEESTNPKEEYKTILESEGYTNYSRVKTEKGESAIMDTERPYVISPDEYGEFEGYDTETLNYYADGVLTDDQGNVIDDVDGLVGEASLKTFGKYEDDAVHVRNDALKTDYEILADVRTFAAAQKFIDTTDEVYE
jgi:hypothetical protein